VLYIIQQGVVVNQAGRVITAYTSRHFDENMVRVAGQLFGGMLFGDEPIRMNEREDLLGNNLYTMMPDIWAINTIWIWYGQSRKNLGSSSTRICRASGII
jgi:hypothetical protein